LHDMKAPTRQTPQTAPPQQTLNDPSIHPPIDCTALPSPLASRLSGFVAPTTKRTNQEAGKARQVLPLAASNRQIKLSVPFSLHSFPSCQPPPATTHPDLYTKRHADAARARRQAGSWAGWQPKNAFINHIKTEIKNSSVRMWCGWMAGWISEVNWVG